MTTFWPTFPPVQSGGRISIGAPDSISARSSAPRRITSRAGPPGAGRDDEIDAMAEGLAFARLFRRHEHGLHAAATGGVVEHLRVA